MSVLVLIAGMILGFLGGWLMLNPKIASSTEAYNSLESEIGTLRSENKKISSSASKRDKDLQKARKELKDVEKSQKEASKSLKSELETKKTSEKEYKSQISQLERDLEKYQADSDEFYDVALKLDRTTAELEQIKEETKEIRRIDKIRESEIQSLQRLNKTQAEQINNLHTIKAMYDQMKRKAESR